MAPSDSSRGPPNPTSTLLQDMLREKKAQTNRVQKTYDAYDGRGEGLGAREIQSSPITSRDQSSATGRRVTAAGIRQPSLPKDMSMKQMEQHLSKTTKQMFDLKIEIINCRQRNQSLEETLEAKVEKLDTIEADNAEMLAINEDLLLELEKRDVAIEEAVNLICELEAKIEEMSRPETDFRDSARTPQTIIADSGIGDSKSSFSDDQQSPKSLEDLHGRAKLDLSPTRPKEMTPDHENSARRIPSFLWDKRKSTNVLRSLYSYDGSIERPGSVASTSGDNFYDGEEDGNDISSPPLTLISEGDLQSVYGDTKNFDQLNPHQSDGLNLPEETMSEAERTMSPRDNQREARIKKWIEERNRPTTPTRAPKSGNNDRFTSIGEVLDKVSSAAKDDEGPMHRNSEQRDRKARSPTKPERKETRMHQRRPSSPAFGGPMFGGAMLPPTPGTMSTATIAGSSSTPSIVAEKSLLDGTPLPAKGYTTLIPDARPPTSESNFAIRLGKALAAEDEFYEEHSSSPSNRSSKATRPPLTTSATDTVFSSEGHASMLPSRTLSYPSPITRARRPSGHLSPTSEESYETISRPRSQKDRGKGAVTPTKPNARETKATSSPPKRDLATPITSSSKPHLNSDTKSGLRSKMRLFRRSSQSTQPQPNAETPSSPRPPVPRKKSADRPPRPTSLYGSSPIYARPEVANDDSERSNIPISPRSHSAILSTGADFLGLTSVDQRGDTTSRQTMRADDGKGKWTLGRTTSTRIREGLGFKRSMSTQGG